MPNTIREAAPPASAYAPGPSLDGGARAAEPPRSGAAPLVEFFTSVLRHRRLILGIALPVALLTAVVCLFRTREYASASSFVPQSKQQNFALSALAAQYGVSVGSGDTQGSPAFYVDLLTSRALLAQIADTTFAPAGRGVRRTLADLYEVREERPGLRREEAMKELRKHMDVGLVQRSGIIRVTVSSPDPAVSQRINGLLLALANDFNLNTRRSQAKAERQFAEERLARVRDDLRAAEDRLARFYQENRVYESSPALTLAQTRLTRELELQRQLNANLSQQLEQAKLDEVRDTPVITVLEQPDLPLRPTPRGTVRYTLFALIGGGVVGVLLALFLDTLRRAVGDGPEQAGEPAEHQHALAGELRRPWRLLRRDAPTSVVRDGAG